MRAISLVGGAIVGLALVALALLFALPTTGQSTGRRRSGEASAGATSVSRRLLASGRLLTARISENGAWVLIDRGSAAHGGGLYLWRRGDKAPRLVGNGERALAVSNDGRRVAFGCGSLTVCIETVNPKRSLRRISLPCDVEGTTRVSDDVSALLVGCTLPHAVRLIRVGKQRTTVTTTATSIEPDRFEPSAAGISADGSTAFVDGSAETGLYVYRATLQRLTGLQGLEAMSANGLLVVAEGPNEQPVLLNLDTGQRRELANPHCLAGATTLQRAVGLSDRGKSVLEQTEQCLPPFQQALELTNTESAAELTLARAANRLSEVQVSSDAEAVLFSEALPHQPFGTSVFIVTAKSAPRP